MAARGGQRPTGLANGPSIPELPAIRGSNSRCQGQIGMDRSRGRGPLKTGY